MNLVHISERIQNPFFDSFISTSDGMKQVRITSNGNTSRNTLFVKWSTKLPVKLINVTEASKRHIQEPWLFYNVKTRSRMKNESLNKIVCSIKNLHTILLKIMIDIKGKVRWLEEACTLVCGEGKKSYLDMPC